MTSTPPTKPVHGTAVAIDGRGVLLTGPSGVGKSDLALRLIDRGAALVADDQTLLRRDGDRVLMSAPDRIAGLFEIRGVGIVELPARTDVPLALCVVLDRSPERLPSPATRDVVGLGFPELALDPLHPSAPIKVERALEKFGKALHAQR